MHLPHNFEEKESIWKMTYKQLTEIFFLLTSIQPLCILFVIHSLHLAVVAVFDL
jgi:hypothetical protein